MVWFWDHYAPDTARRAEPDVSPLQAADLAGLPPRVRRHRGARRLARRGRGLRPAPGRAGVPAKHQRSDGQMHGFFTMVNVLPGSAAAIDHVVATIDEHLAKQPA